MLKMVDKEELESGNERKDFLSNVRNNPWILATLVLAVVSVALVGLNLASTSPTGHVISESEAGEEVVDFLNAQVQDGDVDLESVEEKSGLYEVVLSLDGQAIPVYITKDGENLIPELVPITESAQEPVQEEPVQEEPVQEEQVDYSQEELEQLKEFNDCLADEGMVIYGSDWCPACSQLVEMLGGYEAVSSVYVECTEEQQKCQQEMIGTGVPEIQIDGEMYEGARTLEALGGATGCESLK